MGVGATFGSANSTWNGLKSEKLTGFLGASLRASDKAQWIIQLLYSQSFRDDEREKWHYSMGSRYLQGSSDFRFSVEWAYSKSSFRDSIKIGESLRTTFGLEFKMSQGLWLEVALGGKFPQKTGEPTEMISIANIKYAFQKERRFNTN